MKSLIITHVRLRKNIFYRIFLHVDKEASRLFSSALKLFDSFERPDNDLKTLFQEDFIKMLPGMERRLTGMIIQVTIDSNSIFNYILAPLCESSKAWAF